jgi:IS605 OrfB family transposase
MTILSYCKGLPTPETEMNSLGFTQLEMFLTEVSQIFYSACCETVTHLLTAQKFNTSTTLGIEAERSRSFNKSQWNTHLQQHYRIAKRHAAGVISFAKGALDSAKECRIEQIKTLQGKLKSVQKWIESSERKLKNALKFYSKRNWQQSNTGCVFPIFSSLQYQTTNWQHKRFQLHQKKRRLYKLTLQFEHLKQAPIRVEIPKSHFFLVGSKDENSGNQACQWDGSIVKIRVPACLEAKFGKYVYSQIGGFERKNSRLPDTGAKTWHFYKKNNKWCVALQFTPAPVKQQSRDINYGALGIDLNPGSVGWAYCDKDGNLKAKGKIPLLMGLSQGKQDAQIVKACVELERLANKYACPIVCEELDFSTKKEQLREKGKKSARILSGWAYKRFFEMLSRILNNRGIELLTVNPAYSSVIGLVKFSRMYGLASDESAALAIARRGMRLSEKIPHSLTAYLSVNDEKHVWSGWNKLNRLLKQSRVNRHQFYSIANGESLVNLFRKEVGNDA